MSINHTQYTFLVTISKPPGTTVPEVRSHIENTLRLNSTPIPTILNVRRADRKSVSTLLSQINSTPYRKR